jgi:uncharacterized protein YhjY with autotransporter beta-barrel domain
MRHIKHLFILISFILIAQPAWSQVSTSGDNRSDKNFQDYLRFRCQNDSEFVSVPQIFVFCDNVFQGDFAQQLDSRNTLGIQPNGDKGTPGALKGRPGGSVSSGFTVSAGAEDGGLGVLLTTLSGQTDRNATELENAFSSDLSGEILGIDYQFGDFLIVGMALGSMEDEANVVNNGGYLQTDSSAQTVYVTWMPIGNLSVDSYYGNIDSEMDSIRSLSFASDFFSVEGFISGSYEGTQTIGGASVNYDWYMGSWSLGALAALDALESETDGYNEQGETGFELRYPDQTFESTTRSLGLRLGYSADFEWGALLPNFKIMSVRENENNARNIPLTLASAPDTITPFVAQTDAPDRDYTTAGASLIFAFDFGLQAFLDYEQRTGHDYLDTSSFTLGALYQF